MKSGDIVFETPVVDGRERPVTATEAYRWFQDWERGESLRGDQAIGRKTFTTRMKATDLGPVYKRTNTGPVFLNLNLKGIGDSDDVIVLEDRMRGGGKAAAG